MPNFYPFLPSRKFQIQLFLASMTFLFLGNPTFGCEKPLEGMDENSNPFSSISSSWFPSGFVGYPKLTVFEGKNIVILPVDFKSCYLQLGENPVENSEWSDLGRTHLKKSLEEYLMKKNLGNPKFLSLDEMTLPQQQNLNEAGLLLDLLHINSVRHLPKIPEKKVSDYSLGEELTSLYPEADVFVLLKGRYYVNSPGREAAAMGVTAGVVASTMASPFLGGATMAAVNSSAPGMMMAPNSVTISFFEATTGNLIWLKHELVSNDAFNLRNSEETERFVNYLMREFLF